MDEIKPEQEQEVEVDLNEVKPEEKPEVEVVPEGEGEIVSEAPKTEETPV